MYIYIYIYVYMYIERESYLNPLEDDKQTSKTRSDSEIRSLETGLKTSMMRCAWCSPCIHFLPPPLSRALRELADLLALGPQSIFEMAWN